MWLISIGCSGNSEVPTCSEAGGGVKTLTVSPLAQGCLFPKYKLQVTQLSTRRGEQVSIERVSEQPRGPIQIWMQNLFLEFLIQQVRVGPKSAFLTGSHEMLLLLS